VQERGHRDPLIAPFVHTRRRIGSHHRDQHHSRASASFPSLTLSG
jgi:hypothetical protein